MEYKLYKNIEEVRDTIIDKSSEKQKELKEVKQEFYALWQECFGDSKAYTDFYFTWKVQDNQILSIYNQDKLCSMLHLNPYVVNMQGKKVALNYIVGVATKQQERRKGYMKLLLEAALHQMYQEHMPLTYLMPAAEAIYLPFDFRIVYEQEPWNRKFLNRESNILKIASIAPNDQNDISILSLSKSDTKKIDDLVDFSNRQLSKEYDIYIERTPYYYKRLIHEMESTSGEVLLCFHGKKLVGYVSYMAEGNIYITEIFSSQGNKEAVIDAVSDYLSQIRVKLDTLRHSNNDINLVNDNDKTEENHTVPAIMARIVDFRSFVRNISTTEEIKLVIKVSDSIIKENNGNYTLMFSGQGCEVTESTEIPEVSADIAQLTSLFFARLDLAELRRLIIGENRKNIIQKISKINYYKKVFINDVV